MATTKVLRPIHKESLSISKLIGKVRDFKEHNKMGADLKESIMLRKEKFVMKMNPTPLKIEEEYLRNYDLERVPISRMKGQMGIMLSRFGKLSPKIEQEFMRIYQQTAIRQYKSEQLSLTTTHINFANLGAFMIAVNMNPSYAHGVVHGRKCQVTIFDGEGRRVNFDDKDMAQLGKELEAVVQKFRKRKQKEIEQSTPEKSRERLLSTDEEGSVSHMVSFAECDGGVEETMETLVAMDKAPPSLPKPPAIPPTPSDIPAAWLVQPLFSVFFEPFLHHMLVPSFYQYLPISPYFKYRKEYIGGENTRVFRDPDQLRISRTNYPLPPPELLETQPYYGNSSIWNDRATTVGWATSRDQHKREWKQDWSKGYLPNTRHLAGNPNDDDDDGVVM